MKIRKQINSLIVMVILLVVVSCAGMSQNQTTISPKQQASIWMTVYNAEYDDAMSVMTNNTSSSQQRATALKKKSILTQAWPLLKAYADIADSGGTPTADSTAQIMDLINQLTTLAGG